MLFRSFNSYDNREHIVNDLHNPNHQWNRIVDNLNAAAKNNFRFWCAFILNQYKTCHRRDTDFWKDHTAVEYDYHQFLINNLTNPEVWPDYGASMMFHQTLAARNIQWDTGNNNVPFELYERDVPTMNHYDYIESIREGKLKA